jgi:hypothetical protein
MRKLQVAEVVGGESDEASGAAVEVAYRLVPRLEGVSA